MGRCLCHLALVGVLLFPIVVVVLDHHGAERLSTHEHPTVRGAPVAAHPHEFERAHAHVPQAAAPAATGPAVAPATPDALAAASAVEPLSPPYFLLLIVLAAAGHRPVPSLRRLADQTSVTPPARPPTDLSGRSDAE